MIGKKLVLSTAVGIRGLGMVCLLSRSIDSQPQFLQR